jgi:L-lactate dehydrogenase complex protein LldE
VDHPESSGRGEPMKVALFVTCFNDTMFPKSAKVTVDLLERLGVRVDFPVKQTCCGQMHINTGYRNEAVSLIRRYVEAFEGYDAVVVLSASCAGTVVHYHYKIAVERGDAALRDGVTRVSPKTYELIQFLTDVLKVEDVGAYFPHRSPCGVPELGAGVLTSGNRWPGIIRTCRCDCCT